MQPIEAESVTITTNRAADPPGVGGRWLSCSQMRGAGRLR